MKKVLIAFMLFLVAFTLNIACSKSNDLKATQTKVDAASVVVGSCVCNDTSGTYIPAIVGSTNVQVVWFMNVAHFHRIGHEVAVDGSINIQNGVTQRAVQTNATITFQSPTPPAIITGGDPTTYGTGVVLSALNRIPGVCYVQGQLNSPNITLILRPTDIGPFNVYYHYAYTEATPAQ